MQAYSSDIDRTSIKWLLFGERRVTFINLYPGTYDDDYLVQMRNLFPETEISSSWDPNVEPQKIADSTDPVLKKTGLLLSRPTAR